MKFINLEHHPNDARLRIVDNDICQTLNQRMGTGGGNVPLVMEIHDEEDTNRPGGSGGASIGWNCKELSPALRHDMKHHEPIVVLEDETDNNDGEKVL